MKEEASKALLEKTSRPGNLAFGISRRRLLLDLALLLASALLYSSSFPPLNWDAAAWFCLVPLIVVARSRRPLHAFMLGWAWGFVWAFTSFFWLREIEFFVPIPIALILAFFPAFWCLPLPLMDRFLHYPSDVLASGFSEAERYKERNQHGIAWNMRDVHFCLLAASLWVFLEWTRSWIFTGFPWNIAATSQWRNPAIIQISDITGAYGVSFVIVMLNSSLAVCAGKARTMVDHGRFRRPAALYFSILLIMICLGYGTRKVVGARAATPSRQIKVAVIQADIPQCRIPSEEQAAFALDKNIELTELALMSKPDIVLWPETAVPLPYRASHAISIRYRRELARLAGEGAVQFLIGTIDFGDVPFDQRNPGDIPVHNSAMLVDKDGTIVDKYHKTHLVPFGEYTPFGRYFEPLKRHFGMGRDLTAGRDYTLFELPFGLCAGVNICYEDVFPEISRRLARKGADFIIVLTNDAWYPKSSEPEQHFSHAVFRAVENRRRIVRCGNNSFSCVISPIGVVEDSVTHGVDPRTGNMIPAPSKKSRGYAVFKVEVPHPQKQSFYTRHGDVFILACSLLLTLSAMEILWKWAALRRAIADAFRLKRVSE